LIKLAPRIGLEVQRKCLSALVVSFNGRSRTPDNTPGGNAICWHVLNHAEAALKQVPACALARHSRGYRTQDGLCGAE